MEISKYTELNLCLQIRTLKKTTGVYLKNPYQSTWLNYTEDGNCFTYKNHRLYPSVASTQGRPWLRSPLLGAHSAQEPRPWLGTDSRWDVQVPAPPGSWRKAGRTGSWDARMNGLQAITVTRDTEGRVLCLWPLLSAPHRAPSQGV